MRYQESFIQGNHSIGRVIKPVGLVLHHNFLDRDILLRQMTEAKGFYLPDGRFVPPASYHCIGWENGDRTSFCKDTQKAWHAGKSVLYGRAHCNNFTMSYSFNTDTNSKSLTFSEIDSFLEWFIPKKELWGWRKDMVVDHRFVSPGRKVDLNPKELRRINSAIKYLWDE